MSQSLFSVSVEHDVLLTSDWSRRLCHACCPGACSLKLKDAIYTKITQRCLATLELGTPRPQTDACAKPAFCSKTAVKPAFWPPDGQDGLQTGLLALKMASGRLSWRPRRPADGPPGAQDGLWTGLLAPKTANLQ